MHPEGKNILANALTGTGKRALRLISNPRKYLSLAAKTAERKLSTVFARTAFFLQGQMDISPRSLWYSDRFVTTTGGFYLPGDEVKRRIADLEPWDLVRRDMLILLLRSLNERKILGHMAEVGVYKGVTARLLHQYMPDRVLHLFDTFIGFDNKDIVSEAWKTGTAPIEGHFNDTDIDEVLRYIGKENDNLKIHPGYFPKSIPEALLPVKFAFVHLDADLYDPMKMALEFFYPRISTGGFIVAHDYNAWLGARMAVDEFFADKPEIPIPMPDKSGSSLILKL